MNLGLLALLILIGVIAFGFFRKMNIGILAILAATILGYACGQFTGKDINGGFSASLFLTLAGVTLLFGIVNETGALDLLMQKVIAHMGKMFPLIPLVYFIFCWVVSASGPGLIPTAALLTVLAIPIAKETGFDPVMLCIVGINAANAGRFTHLTVEGRLIDSLLGDQGFHESIVNETCVGSTVMAVILSVVVYVFYKSWKVQRKDMPESGKLEKFNHQQLLSFAGMLVMAALILVLKLETGLAALSVSAVLIFIGICDEGKAVKRIPLNTILLVCGVGVLMNEVISLGGIKLLSAALASMMNPVTASALSGLTAGILSFFSSTLGVVMPTLLPTVGGIISKVGNITPLEIAGAMVFCSSTSGISPASTAGALTMSAVTSDSAFAKAHPARKLFVELFAWAIGSLLIVVVFCLFGFFKWFA